MTYKDKERESTLASSFARVCVDRATALSTSAKQHARATNNNTESGKDLIVSMEG